MKKTIKTSKENVPTVEQKKDFQEKVRGGTGKVNHVSRHKD